MEDPNYKQQLDEALERFVDLATKKGELEVEMAKQRQLISALTNMLPDDEQLEYREVAEALAGKSVGITEAIREALRAVNAWMSASEVKQYLDTAGFDFSGYTSNPLSSINTVLKRLVGEGTATMELSKRGVPCYLWKPPAHPLDKLRAPWRPGLGVPGMLRGKK